MNDFAVSLIRTNVPIVVGAFIAWMISLGITVPEGSEEPLIVALTAALIAGYYFLVRLLEKKWPAFGFLLGTRKEPAYPVAPEGDGRHRADV